MKLPPEFLMYNYVLVSSLQLIRGQNFCNLISCYEDTITHTSEFMEYFKFEKFITTCGECDNYYNLW